MLGSTTAVTFSTMTTVCRSILVAGDIVLDRHTYEGTRSGRNDRSGFGTHVLEEVGGASLTQRLIQAILNAEEEESRPSTATAPAGPPTVCRLGCEPAPPIGSTIREILTAHAVWTPAQKPRSKELVWRVSRPLGFGGASPDVGTSSTLKKRLTPAGEVGVLALEEGGDRFRDLVNEAVWYLPTAKNPTAPLPQWIILKLGGPVGSGDLWARLIADAEVRKRLVVVVSAGRLRQGGVRLSRGLSWERTAEHLMEAIRHDPSARPLGRARHVIVTCEGDGAVWIDQRAAGRPKGVILFDAAHAEGEWGAGRGGEVFGFMTCLTASVAWSLAKVKATEAPDLGSSIARGLSAMRDLQENGHGVALTEKGVCRARRGYPVERLATEILHSSHRYARAEVPTASHSPGSGTPWSIVGAVQSLRTRARPMFGFARQLAIQGEGVLELVPHLRIAGLLTADRAEMETLRSLRTMLVAYRDTNAGKKPLSLGVFGAPGSGKSFGVEQLALGVFGEPGEKGYEGWLEFNLSQFESVSDLVGALHQVRDRRLQGMVPVVFWDEFDAQEFRWLRHLLAPMQDGRFQEGPATHTIGKCVFIFAGGTSHSFGDFGQFAGAGAAATAAEERRFALAKGPDFKSRLDGYLNVVGPNQCGPSDTFFPVKRALMLRNLLGCKPNETLDIDPGLLTALLENSGYTHGARSLAKVLEPLAAAWKATRRPLRQWQLPAPNQLSLHVTNSDEFHALSARDHLFKSDEVVEKLAPAVHQTWRRIARAEKWKMRYDVSYDELPPDIRRSNVAAARRIPDILALVGLQVVPGVASKQAESEVRGHLERHLEALAEEEHKGWMAQLESEGWRFAAQRNDDAKLHDCLRPFHELSEKDKGKDRSTVLHFPDFARLAKYRIAFI